MAENEQCLVPSPSADGFPEDMKMPLLAAFWDDADLTLGDGKLHYKVCTLCDVKNLFRVAVIAVGIND